MIKYGLNDLVHDAYQQAHKSGFHDEDYDTTNLDSFASKLALIHSEVSEALEEARTGAFLHKNWQSLPEKPEGVPAELADVIIRIADLAGLYNIDLEGAVQEKMKFNATRPLRHGKVF